MISFIFVLYCVVGCDLSQPNHRINIAVDTLERCQEVKQNLESTSSTVYSCERIMFHKTKLDARK
jgi:hypothetical protein